MGIAFSPPRFEFEPIRRNRSKVYEEVAEQIERRILEHLQPGDLLPPERELVSMFGVSRSSVRDAIRRLELMGLVEPRQGVGTVVRALSPDVLGKPLAYALVQKRRHVAELLEVRKLIEPSLAARAALHVSPLQLAHLEEILQRQDHRISQGELAIEEDSEFHYGIALAADNSVLLKVVDVLMDLLKETREHSLQVRGRSRKSFARHQRILAALKKHDPAAAELAMRRHLEEIEKVVLKSFDRKE